MIKLCKYNQNNVINKVKNEQLDALALSTSNLIEKYNQQMFVNGYNDTVQKGIMPLLNIIPNIHILDCTDLEVNLKNSNYEQLGLGYSKRDKSPTRGYKLATLRGVDTYIPLKKIWMRT